MRPVVIFSWLAACKLPTGAGEPEQSPAPTELTAETEVAEAGPEPAPSPALRTLEEYPEPWDPNTGLELETLATKTMFVTVDHSGLCPTRPQAEARECGNSVENVDQGLALERGDRVLVVGDAPFDGHWRAIRYQKAGSLPAWIRADDVAERAGEEALDAFERREDMVKAVPVDGMTSAEIGALAPGTLVRWTRKRGVERGQYQPLSGADPGPGVVIYVPTRGGKPVAIELREEPDADHYAYWEKHGGVADEQLLLLDYGCEEGSYCDEVSILARTTRRRARPPRIDPEFPLVVPLPKAWGKRSMPALEGFAVADRFGVWEFRARGKATPPGSHRPG